MDNAQFDKFLGGAVTLPRGVEINKLIAARAAEIHEMSNKIENPKHKKLTFQKLPVHMRRRVMSHNAKRMPRSKRQAHLNQMMKSGLPPKSKRPSRKYRRRPHNLLQEYNRRKLGRVWLETHIWHAKRFHMTEKWGHKIANHSNDRGYRAAYRAVAQHCMIQDISFYSCIELIGPEKNLINTLWNHCKYELSFGAQIYLNGAREGSLTFFKRSGEPIGVITFIWRHGTSDCRTIWLWIHPALYEDVRQELISSFQFKIPGDTLNSLENKSLSNDCDCKMNLLAQSLNRFRLRGPLAISVISDTLRLPKLCRNERETVTAMDESMDVEAVRSWCEDWYRDTDNFEAFEVQKTAFEALGTLNSPSQLPRHSVLALTVLDPRFFLPSKRTKQHLNSNHFTCLHKFHQLANCSPLWESRIRDEVKKNHKTTNEINKLRSGNLVPGIEHDIEFNENIISKVPIILIQYPGSCLAEKSNGFTSGIDIILPAGWALSFWISLIYRCARPGGLREYRSVIFENLMLNSPEINHPDTTAYLREAKHVQKKLQEKYFRFPPNRRVNFVKFAISSPFFCEWKMLVKEWTDSTELHVIRDRKLISSLASVLHNPVQQSENKKFKRPKPLPLPFDKTTALDYKSSLALVKVTIEGRGKPKNFALICLPTDEDLKMFKDNSKWSGPVEKLKEDAFEIKRKTLRVKHKASLKRAMRQRKRARQASKRIVNKSSTEAIKLLQAETMKDLYLPKCSCVRKSCDREVMGYVVQGDFSFTESRGVGWGYVVLQPLLHLIERSSNIVLIRNTQTRQYRRAQIQIIDLHT